MQIKTQKNVNFTVVTEKRVSHMGEAEHSQPPLGISSANRTTSTKLRKKT